jgi:eukaryotic-like serine/threonine-protein kinase
VMENSGWSTYAVPVLGGEPRLVLTNAAGLTWLDRNQLLFAQIRAGQHMGIVTGAATRADIHDVYFPDHERAMAHYARPSPDHTTALIVEMDKDGAWQTCRLVSLDGRSPSRTVGPHGQCADAGWSADGAWMYFAVATDGPHHLWRQRVDGDIAEQLTFGPSDENAIAIDPDGRSLVTSIGSRGSTLWVHEAGSERQVSSEGQIVNVGPFSQDGQVLYYLRQLQSGASRRELRRLSIETGKSDVMLEGVSILDYDVSTDGRRAVYRTAKPDGSSQVWLAPIDRSAPPRPIGLSGDASPMFGPDGWILFRFTEGNFNYLGRMNEDGTGRSKVVPYPVSEIQGISPGRTWVMALAPLLDKSTVAPMAIPVHGGNPVRICEIYCQVHWSANGRFVFASVEERSLASPGRTLVIPIGPGEALPTFPPGGIPPFSNAVVMPGTVSMPRADVLPGADADTFAYVRTGIHRNLFRMMLP